MEPFTIYHGPGNVWQIEIPHGQDWNEQYYALAHRPPRYPVPAVYDEDRDEETGLTWFETLIA